MDWRHSFRPITNRRLQRMASVLARRQPDVAVVLENVHDPHNVSAVLRSCEATGVPNVHLVYTEEEVPRISTGVAAGAHRWLSVHHHESIAGCYGALNGQGVTVYAATTNDSALDLHDLDLTRPCAFVFGNESRGLTGEAVERAGAQLRIPMMGMVESLNISVACAVTLYEMLRQRRGAGRYDAPGMDVNAMKETLAGWLHREDRDPRRAAAARFEPARFPPARARTEPEQGDDADG